MDSLAIFFETIAIYDQLIPKTEDYHPKSYIRIFDIYDRTLKHTNNKTMAELAIHHEIEKSLK